MDRFFAAPSAWREGMVSLDRDESLHCLRVMRKRAGDVIEVFDGEGRWARGAIADAAVEEGAVQVKVGEEGRSGERPPALTLALAIPKGKTMELVVQKAVELGTAAIQPLLTEHTVVRLGGEEAGRKQSKWQRTALEACKQCGQNTVPTVHAPLSLSEWLAKRGEGRAGLLASLGAGAVSLREGIGRVAEDAAGLDVLIGPEGDFSAEETAAARAAGFQAVSLGEFVLRTETAAIFALSVIGYELRLE